ncbi:MAG: cytochrome ubiquinol oxidase subunit I [Anaerolineaceae bacterium]
MDVLTLSRLQFGLTTVYHFFFVPLTIGLAFYVAILQTIYVKTGNEEYKKLTRFWGNLFLINFAVGVVTGLVMEFQFGMNWAEYSRFVGDVFGAPLAIEGLTAFFLESTFLGLWIFGWERLNKKLHLATIWLVAIGSVLSAMWILMANAFMQQPVGYQIVDGRAVMTDFGALLTNSQLFVQFPHTILSGLVTASFFILGISAYHLLRNKSVELFKKSFKLSLWIGVAVTFLIIVAGHLQTLHIFQNQPMKMAAAEALWQTEDPASFSIISIPDQANRKDFFAIRVPVLTSFMIYLKPSGEVLGINNLQNTYEQKYGSGYYIPPVAVAYFAFRVMVGAGFLMLGVTAYFFLMAVLLKKDPKQVKFLALLPLAIIIPYLANSSGWILTEMGRQPWVVFGLLQTAQAYSPSVSTGEVLTSLITFIVIYSALIAVDITLLAKVAKAGPQSAVKPVEIEDQGRTK